MRIMIKGGVWKNTEDEILKAAVMKYGKNQWARISSLLVRKSAKQCKARWYEWLDPSIKKTEWTRDEDEKLLHLAKLMPTQWRTIAPIVGRTPAQCLERYEKLLDAAASKDEAYEAADDPRRLRPGEIDPNPESKPARPDPVDMDEDEKEMLSEARARLANTRGKKAKRKAREKQLEEARRLAALQKKRELKAAGIDVQRRHKKMKGIDYNKEIAFEKKPPPGFFDTTGEQRVAQDPRKINISLAELEGKRRIDEEMEQRKQDMNKQKLLRKDNLPAVVMQANKMNDPEAVRKRSKLMLPAPQVSDRELEEIAKLGYSNDLVGPEGEGPTGALLASYGQTPRVGPGTTPLRTPLRTPGGKGDAIMMEAENLARLRETKTPLFGGENPTLHPTDFSGVTPKPVVMQTPNPVATPLRTPGMRVGMTPGATPGGVLVVAGTPIRDQLHINEPGGETPGASSREEKLRQAELRQSLRSGLGNLPAPKNEYQIVVPDLPEDEQAEELGEEDMADVRSRKEARIAAAEAAELRKRSEVIKRGLPRPASAAAFAAVLREEAKGAALATTALEQADALIRAEMLALLERDSIKYPVADPSGGKDKKKKGAVTNGVPAQQPVPQLEEFDEDDLGEAKLLITEEGDLLREALGHEDATLEQYEEAFAEVEEDYSWLPTQNHHALASLAPMADRLAAQQHRFASLKKQMEVESKKALKLEAKIKMLHGGYEVRAGALWRQIEGQYKEADTLGTELECFQALFRQEQLSIPRRLEGLKEELNVLRDRERGLQVRYENLLVEQDHLRRKIQEHDEAAKAKANQERARAEEEQQGTAKTEELEERVRESESGAEAKGDEVMVDAKDGDKVTEAGTGGSENETTQPVSLEGSGVVERDSVMVESSVPAAS